jgi:hypothetical protein
MVFYKYRKAEGPLCKRVRIKSNLDKVHVLKCKTEMVDSELN